ncbi:hypothetical protein BcDW1_5449 [Botrytis cinerea BcDW1]|uniref:Ankyrin repeat protein n=1 Tax=Botryotinia fuckeliana (strain BcDW1) TaxID=1290391 RepID=M7TQQ2_BOTF1|nr:hypothetical protein BcDW1_5449 [Botrytis cinerea BcDW1]
MVRALKKLGMDLNMADPAGVPVLLLTALEFAEKDFILKILPEIDVIQHPKLGTTLNQASFQGLLKIVSALLNRELRIPGGVNNNGPQGMPLMVACYDGIYYSVVYLLKHGANTACKKLDGIKTTAMQSAHLHKDVMLLLQNFRKNGPRASEEQRTVVNANISML